MDDKIKSEAVRILTYCYYSTEKTKHTKVRKAEAIKKGVDVCSSKIDYYWSGNAFLNGSINKENNEKIKFWYAVKQYIENYK